MASTAQKTKKEIGYDHKFVDPVPNELSLPDLSTGSQRSLTVYLLWEGVL